MPKGQLQLRSFIIKRCVLHKRGHRWHKRQQECSCSDRKKKPSEMQAEANAFRKPPSEWIGHNERARSEWLQVCSAKRQVMRSWNASRVLAMPVCYLWLKRVLSAWWTNTRITHYLKSKKIWPKIRSRMATKMQISGPSRGNALGWHLSVFSVNNNR